MKTINNSLLLALTISIICCSSCSQVEKTIGTNKDNRENITTSGANYMLETVGGIKYYGKHRRNPKHHPAIKGDLFGFNNCQEAETYIKERILESLEASFAQQKMWYMQSLRNPNQYSPMGDNAPEASTASAQEKSGASDQNNGPSDFTTTNNQVEGVEEGDILKNDGTYIYTISQGEVHIVKSWPADQMSEVSVISTEAQAHTLLLAEKDLIVLAHPNFEEDKRCKNENFRMEQNYGYFCSYQQYDVSKNIVQIYNIENPAQPVLKNTYALSGIYNNIRRVGSSIRIVTQSYLDYYRTDLVTYIDTYQKRAVPSKASQANYILLSEKEFDSAVIDAMAKNEEAIKALHMEDLFNSGYWYSYGNSISEKKALVDFGDCRKIHAPSVPAELGLTQIATINIESGTFDLTSLLAYSNIIYASKENLYITTPFWNWFSWEQDTDATYVHQMNIAGTESSRYVGSGKIDGTIINQFAMDEYRGNLRIASTVNKLVSLDDAELMPWQRFSRNQYSQVTILKSDANHNLVVIGTSEKMGEDERIQSVRFFNERGFVVTFRNTDPLFTLDLSDPTKPSVVGGLVIPGFSSYLHMIDDHHIIGVGVSENWGLKISLFDVSNMKSPQEVDKFEIPGSSSEAQWDHKAFTWYPSHKLLALPVSSYTTSRYISNLRILSIDAENGINDSGSVTMSEMNVDAASPCAPYAWINSAAIQRSIFADDFVYAISTVGIKAVDLSNLSTPIPALSFTQKPETENFYCQYY